MARRMDIFLRCGARRRRARSQSHAPIRLREHCCRNSLIAQGASVHCRALERRDLEVVEHLNTCPAYPWWLYAAAKTFGLGDLACPIDTLARTARTHSYTRTPRTIRSGPLPARSSKT